MARVLLIRLDAPLMSFGGASVDNHGYVEAYPAFSMLTGLFANALGWRHEEFGRLQRLQERLHFAAHCDLPGEPLIDFQTVALGQDSMSDKLGWTTRGKIEKRDGGSSKETHIRYRHYLANAVDTLGVRLEPEDESPNIDSLAEALKQPSRPLFIGRKCCIPSAPLLLTVTEAFSPLSALKALPRIERWGIRTRGPLSVWWDAEAERDETKAMEQIAVSDGRDWANQVHVGRRFIYHGEITPPDAGAA